MASMDTQCDYTKGSNGKEWKNAANVLLGDMLLMTVIKTVPHIKKQKDTCTPVLTEALFTIATTWKQPKHPLRDEWIHIPIFHTKQNTGILLSHQKNEILPFVATWMDPEIIIVRLSY